MHMKAPICPMEWYLNMLPLDPTTLGSTLPGLALLLALILLLREQAWIALLWVSRRLKLNLNMFLGIPYFDLEQGKIFPHLESVLVLISVELPEILIDWRNACIDLLLANRLETCTLALAGHVVWLLVQPSPLWIPNCKSEELSALWMDWYMDIRILQIQFRYPIVWI